VESRLNCTIPRDRRLPGAGDNECFKLPKFRQMYADVVTNSEDVTEMTNCAVPCNRNHFSARNVESRTSRDKFSLIMPIKLEVYYSRSRFTQKEQFMTYSAQSLIADIG
jgi:hypothetical protein